MPSTCAAILGSSGFCGGVPFHHQLWIRPVKLPELLRLEGLMRILSASYGRGFRTDSAEGEPISVLASSWSCRPTAALGSRGGIGQEARRTDSPAAAPR